MFEIFNYAFAVRGLEAGIVVGLVAPLVGMFLVLRGYSLIVDTLAHVSLAGIAISFLFGSNPVLTAMISTVVSSMVIERLRGSKAVYGESALAIFLSGSLALAVVIISLANGFNSSLLNYLFGSIVTVKPVDLYAVLALGLFVGVVLLSFYKEFVYVTFDEESAKVSGLPVKFLNNLLITLAALTVSISMPIVGVLLISALMVIPVVAAMQFGQGFGKTLLLAEAISLVSVVLGIIISYQMALSTGGTIVLVALSFFLVILLAKRK